MKPKKINLSEDETFPPNKICLVGMEPVSNYIVQGGVNKYAKSRGERPSLVSPFEGFSESAIEIRNEIKKALS